MYAHSHGILPNALQKMLTTNKDIHSYGTRNKNNPHVKQRKTKIASKSIRHQGPVIWYDIALNIRNAKTINSFTYQLKRMLIQHYC